MSFADELAALGVQGREDLLNTLNGGPQAEMQVQPEQVEPTTTPAMEMQQDMAMESPEMSHGMEMEL